MCLRTEELVELFLATRSHLSKGDYLLATLTDLLRVHLLTLQGFVAPVLKVVLSLLVDVKAVRQGNPLGSVDEFLDVSVTLFFV
jgi:hypothetical protein